MKYKVINGLQWEEEDGSLSTEVYIHTKFGEYYGTVHTHAEDMDIQSKVMGYEFAEMKAYAAAAQDRARYFRQKMHTIDGIIKQFQNNKDLKWNWQAKEQLEQIKENYNQSRLYWLDESNAQLEAIEKRIATKHKFVDRHKWYTEGGRDEVMERLQTGLNMLKNTEKSVELDKED